MSDLEFCPSRRSILRTVAALGAVSLVPGALVACTTEDEPSTEPTAAGDGETGADGGGGSASVAASEVAMGTAVLVQTDSGPVLVAQPTEGEFVAYSAACTHQGTTVSAGELPLVTCPNHGSQFDLTNGAEVVEGPATQPLPQVTVSQEGDMLVLA